MNWRQYLIPDNAIAIGIWYLLILVFALWVVILLIEFFSLRRKKKQLSKCEHIEDLEVELNKQIAWRNAERAADAGPHQDQTINHVSAFLGFSSKVGLKFGNVFVDHVRTIFEAGWNNSQLQVDSLVKNTASRLFRGNGLLRSVLSLFIIIGLLGTLFGLAYSLAQLVPLAANSNQISNPAIASGLINLLTQLRGAFAPSIWGVAFTIVGVLLFSLYLYRCQTLRDRLEHVTLTVWVPKLYPTPFQQQLITLIQTEELIRQNRDSIRTVADFARDIKTDVEDFGTEIKKAKTTIKNLNKSSSQINDFADRFQTSAEKLVSFKQELAQLYTRLIEDSKVFQEGVTKSLGETTETHRHARDTLTEQSQQLKAISERLLSYERAYVESRHELDATLKTVMEDARKAYQGIGERNQEIAAAISESLSAPLRQDLVAGLGKLDESLQAKLGGMVDRLDRLDKPITTAAEKFEQLVGNILSQARELIARLQHEYNQQNQANVEQLQKLEELNAQIVSFLGSLNTVILRQEASYAQIGEALPKIHARLKTIVEDISHLSATVSLAEPATDKSIQNEIKQNAANIQRELHQVLLVAQEIRNLQADTRRTAVLPASDARDLGDRQVEHVVGSRGAPGTGDERAMAHAAAGPYAGRSQTVTTHVDDHKDSANTSFAESEKVVPNSNLTDPTSQAESLDKQSSAESAGTPIAIIYDDSSLHKGRISRIRSKLRDTTRSLRNKVFGR